MNLLWIKWLHHSTTVPHKQYLDLNSGYKLLFFLNAKKNRDEIYEMAYNL